MAYKYFVLDDQTGKMHYVSLGFVFEKEVPTGTVNGANSVFTLAFVPQSENSVNVFLDGILVLPNKYILDLPNRTITFETAPATGQDVFATYMKA